MNYFIIGQFGTLLNNPRKYNGIKGWMSVSAWPRPLKNCANNPNSNYSAAGSPRDRSRV